MSKTYFDATTKAGDNVALTRYACDGHCLQLDTHVKYEDRVDNGLVGIGSARLTRAEAIVLVNELLRFITGHVTNFDPELNEFRDR